MELTDRELRDLALFFAKRMDTALVALDPTDPPPPGDPRSAWFDKLASAQDSGRLSALMNRIAAVDPDDENLQQACTLLRTPNARFEAYSVGLALVGGTGVLLLSIAAASGVLAASALVGDTEAVVEIAPVEASPPTAPPVEVAMAPEEEPAPAPVEEASLAHQVPPDVVEIPAPPVKRVAKAAPPATRCTATAGDIVGYWYAGEHAPGTAGEMVTVPHAVNVRADYPDVHNNFDARARINCVLQEGDIVKLSRDPILVPADRYWIPLVSGDLIASS